jgi:SAM-dependent methyltransferase
VSPHAVDPFDAWLEALEARHLARLRFPEVSRALRALSSAYVERRDRLAHGAALDGGGKRAAFALFYGPLHFLTVREIVSRLPPPDSPIDTIVDLGCGTGAAGAAWATAMPDGRHPQVVGIDRHQWAVAEAAWTYRTFGLRGRTAQDDSGRARIPLRRAGLLAAYLVNELTDDGRAQMLRRLLDAVRKGAAVLVVEPISRRAVPWWDGWAEAFAAAGGRADEWRFDVTLPDIVHRLDRAAGLSHGELTARSIAAYSLRPTAHGPGGRGSVRA